MTLQALTIRNAFSQLYVAALTVFALVASATYLATAELSRIEETRDGVLSTVTEFDAAVQRAALIANAHSAAAPAPERKALGADLRRTARDIRTAHDFLTLRGDANATERGQLAPVQTIYFSEPAFLDNAVSAFLDDIDETLNAAQAGRAVDAEVLARINRAAGDDLARGHGLVLRTLRDRGGAAIVRLERVQTLFWIVTLLTFLLAGAFFFRPFAKRLEDSVRAIENAEAATQLAADAARKANEANANFLRVISHEIRTPLNAVTGITHLLNTEELTGGAIEQLRHLSAASHHLFSLTENVLDFNNLKSGRICLTAAPFNLRDELVNCADIVAPLAEEKGLTLSLDLAELSAAPFEGDASRIRQILLNLLANALKFTDRGSISLSCKAIREETGVSTFVIRVSDTGVGIAPDAREKIFRSFSQIDAFETRRQGGAGLGLAIVDELVKAMGGAISVESEPGAGSHFSVTLSLPKATMTEQFGAAEIPALEGSRRVLIVEDNVPNQLIAKAFLKAAGFDVVIANNGKEAIEAVSKQKFDLVLMDINMPVMDGLEATRILRQNPAYKKTPILAFTAHAIDEDQSTLLNAGLNEVLKKPVTEKGLVRSVRQWIASDTQGPSSNAA